MARNDGHNIGCGTIIFIVIACTILTCLIISPDEDNLLLTILFGLGIGYVVASYVNSSDRFKDL